MRESREGTDEERRQRFGEGPWLEEPDRIEWRIGAVVGLMVRNPILGHWCGYVGVPPGHPWHGKDDEALGGIEVHGGVTYTNECGGLVCHVPEPGEPEDLWWVGFDCAHCDDLSPGTEQSLQHLPAWVERRRELYAYRDRAYVQAEVEQLAEQAASTEPRPEAAGAAAGR